MRLKDRYIVFEIMLSSGASKSIGLSETAPGQVVIEVYTKKPNHQMRRLIPETLERIPVKMIETGEIIAF